MAKMERIHRVRRPAKVRIVQQVSLTMGDKLQETLGQEPSWDGDSTSSIGASDFPVGPCAERTWWAECRERLVNLLPSLRLTSIFCIVP